MKIDRVTTRPLLYRSFVCGELGCPVVGLLMLVRRYKAKIPKLDVGYNRPLCWRNTVAELYLVLIIRNRYHTMGGGGPTLWGVAEGTAEGRAFSSSHNTQYTIHNNPPLLEPPSQDKIPNKSIESTSKYYIMDVLNS